ncbi:MAG: PEP-CTERM sorting domain-containing protein [Phycisphaerales bacterium]|nr:PEP-CTERM sorting domain-containing protein [Phycisphaerales bacterium]
MGKFCLAAAACAALVAANSEAAILGTFGQVTQIAQPADAQLDVLTTTSFAYCWNEVQDVALSQDVWVNAFAPGNYNSSGSLTNTQIAQGTRVRSHYIHFDAPPGGSGAIQGFVKFDRPIIGVIVLNTPGFRHLDDSDFLGAPTLFTSGSDFRGMEMVNDSFTITVSGDTLQFSMGISQPGDFIRVLTEGDVPAPSVLSLAGMSLFAIGRRRR